MNINNNPCKKDCPDRNATCHAVCEKYKDYLERLEKAKAEHRAERLAHIDVTDYQKGVISAYKHKMYLKRGYKK